MWIKRLIVDLLCFAQSVTIRQVIRSIAMLLFFGTAIGSACSCAPQTVAQSRAEAHVVFRGKIEAFRESDKLGRIAIFRVDRVWKGAVSKTVEMLTSEGICGGFSSDLVRKGNVLLVYGYGGEGLYVTDLCTRTRLAKGNPDLGELGKGTSPK
jgi:hypothetical protein